jgi:hypothetical protein
VFFHIVFPPVVEYHEKAPAVFREPGNARQIGNLRFYGGGFVYKRKTAGR